MLDRRFKGKGWAHPDLIVIDGGKGQLSSAMKIMSKYELKIPIIGLAKRFEEIIFAKEKNFESINITNSSPAIKVLQKGYQLRDKVIQPGKVVVSTIGTNS